MKKILLTGSTGFIGRNIYPKLCEKYEVIAPKRHELNLMNSDSVHSFFEDNSIDVILHCANPNPSPNNADSTERMFEDSLRIFLNLSMEANCCEKMVYLGSGAEYNKSMDICQLTEEDSQRSIPKDQYGFGKYVMNRISMNSDNIYNLRVFGCYGPGDAPQKFITHAIRSNIMNVPITIRKDCYFDYIHVDDLFLIIDWAICNKLKFHEYNACSGERHKLSELAQKTIEFMCVDNSIKILSNEIGKEYTGCNRRLVDESKINFGYSIDTGIKAQIDWELKNWTENTVFDGE